MHFLHHIQNTLPMQSTVGANILLMALQMQITKAVCLLAPDNMVPYNHAICCSAFLKSRACTTFCAILCRYQTTHLAQVKRTVVTSLYYRKPLHKEIQIKGLLTHI